MNILDNFDTAEIARQQPFAYWLHKVEKIGNAGKVKLLDTYGTPEEIYRAEEKSLKTMLDGEQVFSILQAKKPDIYREYEEMSEQGIIFFPFYHPAFPKHLASIPDKPFGIYVKGQLPDDAGRSVAIVGARNCSEYGRYVAETFAKELAQEGVQIISGMAKGIDGIAQNAALEAGGDTYGVLGCGVDICYPSAHRELYENICKNGGILSTYPPGTKPLPMYFPPRNRIISGLADAVLVVEARQKSGTLITVDMALEQGREVYVVPGRITDRLSDGCNRLLLQGAGAALAPGQLFQELSETVWSSRKGPESSLQKNRITDERAGRGKTVRFTGNAQTDRRDRLTAQEKALLSLLDLYPISLDQIRIMMQTSKELCGLTLPQTMEMLLKLTMEGFVKKEGGYYGLNAPL